MDYVDVDIVLAGLKSGGPCETSQRPFRGTVVRAVLAASQTKCAPYVDDPPAATLNHIRQHIFHGQEARPNICDHRPVKLFHRDFPQWSIVRTLHAGGIEQNVDTAEGFMGSRD